MDKRKNVTIRMSDGERKLYKGSLSKQIRLDRKLVVYLEKLAEDPTTADWPLAKAIKHVKGLIGEQHEKN